MEILSVTLKNFKSHRDRRVHFRAGTNAICGENGAGKTSILEAIAWTLFNYRGAYRNEDLIHNGASSTQATVSFISQRDGRTYDVHRCTTKGYTIFDPQLGQRLDYHHIEEEVMPWLRQHLGVPAGTDLGKLFANTIGVPQGTFTADFLQPSERRKPVFDAILKVEEYRQVTQEMLSLDKYARAAVETLERAIVEYEERLQGLSPLQERCHALTGEIAANEQQLQTLQAELAQLQAEKDRLSGQAQQLQTASMQRDRTAAQIEGQRQANQHLAQAIEQSRQAVQVCEVQRTGYQLYLQAEAALKELDHQVKQRQRLSKQREACQKKLATHHTDLMRLQVQLEALEQSQEKLLELEPLIQQQVGLEQRQQTIAEQLQHFQALRLEYTSQTNQMNQLRSEQTRLLQEVERLQRLTVSVEQIPDLEQRRDRLQEHLTRVEAARQFEAELRQLVEEGESRCDCYQLETRRALDVLEHIQHSIPLLTRDPVEALRSALQSGVNLNRDLLNALDGILDDLAEQTSVTRLEQQLRAVKAELAIAYQCQSDLAALMDRQERLSQIQHELNQGQSHLDDLQHELTTEQTWADERSQVLAELSALGDPRGQSRLLQAQLEQQIALQTQFDRLKSTQTSLEQDLAALEEQLAAFATLEDDAEQQRDLRQAHHTAYLTFLKHQKQAESLPALLTDWDSAIAQLQQLEAEWQTLTTEYDQLTQNYDPQHYQRLEVTYADTRSQADQLAGAIPPQKKLLTELELQRVELQAVADACDRARADLKQRERIRRFIAFARKSYKEAGPRITECYVQTISREADRLFRELINRPNVTLQWTRDYEILVQEGPHTRRFLNLSGGEQMCAALAVRLALLRILADIDIAFFDEPTTNMDRPRRESLAEAIARIKTFRQLFVVSHDDTFEKVTEHVVFIERDGS